MTYRDGHIQTIWTGNEWRVEVFRAGQAWIVSCESLDPAMEAARRLIDSVTDLGHDLRIERAVSGTVLLTERRTTDSGTEVIKMDRVNG